MPLVADACPPGFPIDDIYARLVAMGDNQDQEEARAMLSALVLVLVNHVADARIINEAIDLVETAFRNSSVEAGSAAVAD